MGFSLAAFQGALRSKIVYLSAGVVLLGYLGQNPAGLEPLVSAASIGVVVSIGNYILGGLLLVARFFTDAPLEDKVSP